MNDDREFKYTMPDNKIPSRVYIEINNKARMRFTLFNRFKVKLWNFILPPQIHLYLHDVEED